MTSGGRHFLIGFVAVLALCLVLVAPLCFHHSDVPTVGPWSTSYALMLLAALCISIVVSAMVGWSCRRGGLQVVLKGLFSVGIFLTACAVVEFALQREDLFREYRKWGHKKSILFGFESMPRYEWQASGAWYRTDSQGFRMRPESDLPPQEGGVTIAVMGGSSVFGYALNDDEAWPYQLELALRDLGRENVSVINAGVNGHNSLQVLLRYYVRVRQNKPDYLVYYQGYNDIGPTRIAADYVFISEDILFSEGSSYWANKNPYLRSRLGRRVASLLRGARQRLVGRRQGGRTGSAPGAVPWGMDAPLDKSVSKNASQPSGEWQNVVEFNAGRFEDNLVTLGDMCRRSGCQLVVTTFIFDSDEMRADAAQALEALNEAARRMAKKEGFPLIDLAARFASEPDKAAYFHDDHYHPNGHGARWIARMVSGELNAIIGE